MDIKSEPVAASEGGQDGFQVPSHQTHEDKHIMDIKAEPTAASEGDQNDFQAPSHPGDPFPDAVINVWHMAVNGQYEQQDREDLNLDPIFAVKEELVVDFVPRYRDPMADWELEYDFVLGAL